MQTKSQYKLSSSLYHPQCESKNKSVPNISHKHPFIVLLVSVSYLNTLLAYLTPELFTPHVVLFILCIVVAHYRLQQPVQNPISDNTNVLWNSPSLGKNYSYNLPLVL